MNNIQISAPSNPRHQISVTVDPNLGYVVAVQKANGNLGRKKALRERRLTAVQQFLQTKYCEYCKQRPVAARVCLGDKTFSYCKECTLREQAEYEKRLRNWENLQRQRSGGAPDPRQQLAIIEELYERAMKHKIGGEIAYEQLSTHFDKLLAGVIEGGNGIDLEFRYVSIASQLGALPAEKFNRKPNIDLNRYVNVVAPDHTLVPMPSNAAYGEDLHDYINANYVDSLLAGRSGHHRYIATQGPLPNTINDFWLMVWHENVSVIVMLTRAIEKDVVKCETYWPEPDQAFGGVETLYKIINVRLVESGGDPNITERRFLITNTEEKRTRELVHFQYTEWPDWGSPANADA